MIDLGLLGSYLATIAFIWGCGKYNADSQSDSPKSVKDVRSSQIETWFDVSIVLPSGISVFPNGNLKIRSGNLIEFKVLSAMSSVDPFVAGTCPSGFWIGDTYKTAAILTDCSVQFFQTGQASSSPSSGAPSVSASGGSSAVNPQTSSPTTLDPTTLDPAAKAIAQAAACFGTMANRLNFTDHIRPILETAECTLCHSEGEQILSSFEKFGTIDLSMLKDVPGVLNFPRKLVYPGNPLDSLIFLAITNDPSKNLYNNIAFHQIGLADENMICNWILQGAN